MRPPRLHRLNIRLLPEEWDKVNKLFHQSTCRSVSEYARKVLLAKPVRVFYRNQSFDDFGEQVIRLLPQLENFGDHFQRLVQKLLSISIAEVSAVLPGLLDCQRHFEDTAEEIRRHIEKLSDQCDQK